MVLVDSDGISLVPPYSGSYPPIPPYEYGTITRYGPAFQKVLLRVYWFVVVLQPRVCRNKPGLGYSALARHY